MTYSEIMESSKVIMVGGAETSASALSAITYYLLSTPSAMAKLTAEIRSAFKSESEINMASVQSLKYTHAVIHEGLRLFPPLPGSMRRIVPAEGRLIAGHYMPGGTIVVVDTYAAGRSSRNFTRATEFCPERQLGSDPEFQHDKLKAIRPFSVGPRDCLGKSLALAEMKIILARVVFNFDLQLLDQEKDWLAGIPVYTFWEKPPLMVKLSHAVR